MPTIPQGAVHLLAVVLWFSFRFVPAGETAADAKLCPLCYLLGSKACDWTAWGRHVCLGASAYLNGLVIGKVGYLCFFHGNPDLLQDILLIHLGGKDFCQRKASHRSCMSSLTWAIKVRCPMTWLVWLALIPHMVWKVSCDLDVLVGSMGVIRDFLEPCCLGWLSRPVSRHQGREY